MKSVNLGGVGKRIKDIAHVLYGVLTVFAPWYIALIMGFTFALYELNEELHLRDKAYKDLLEYMAGLAMGVIVYIAASISGCGR